MSAENNPPKCINSGWIIVYFVQLLERFLMPVRQYETMPCRTVIAQWLFLDKQCPYLLGFVKICFLVLVPFHDLTEARTTNFLVSTFRYGYWGRGIIWTLVLPESLWYPWARQPWYEQVKLCFQVLTDIWLSALVAEDFLANSTIPRPVDLPRSSAITTARSTGPNLAKALSNSSLDT